MKLSAEELKWIEERMTTYQIKRGATYYEILDHIILAIEQKREAGDKNAVEILFQQVVDGDFGGNEGIQDLVIKQENIYKQSIQRRWILCFKHYLTWRMLSFIMIALFLSIKLPDVRQVKAGLLIVYVLLAWLPGWYAYFSLRGRVLKSIEGNQSFLKAHLVTMVCTPTGFISLVTLYYPFYYPWSFIDYLSPIIFMVVIILFVLINLTTIRFCNQFTNLNPTTK